jgi:RimJ/RimL family protein N-acetyltransferase|tara:strand:- start:30104 stop:30568 length:465 start_codon:yes stop_codon:yes gene_type:complete
MILERTKDLSAIKSFMMLPEIYRQAAEDGASLDPDFTESDREVWLLAIDDGVTVGIVHSHLENGSTAWFHPYILSKHKADYLKLVNLFLKWFDLYFPIEIQKLNAYMPTYAKKAYQVALSAGFKDEGLNRMSYEKNGKLWDRHLVGLIRSELNV